MTSACINAYCKEINAEYHRKPARFFAQTGARSSRSLVPSIHAVTVLKDPVIALVRLFFGFSRKIFARTDVHDYKFLDGVDSTVTGC